MNTLKIIFISLTVCISVLNVQSSAFAANKTFTLVNKSGKTVTAVYYIPTNAKNRGKNLLPSDTIFNGYAKIFYNTASRKINYRFCLFLQGKDDKVEVLTWKNVDFSKVSRITIKPKAEKKGYYNLIYE